jgi:hypothetical protein
MTVLLAASIQINCFVVPVDYPGGLPEDFLVDLLKLNYQRVIHYWLADQAANQIMKMMKKPYFAKMKLIDKIDYLLINPNYSATKVII